MLNIIITAVFKLIQIIGKIIITPVILIVTPFLNAIGFSQFTSSILNFIEIALTYVQFVVDIFHIPPVLLTGLVSLGATILTFNITLYAYSLIMLIYKTVKSGSE